ncbi:MAG: recombinase family protein, partial [Actinobacteria bacterium]|nr:recombinase family protein [Actinomycetota bacterium]
PLIRLLFDLAASGDMTLTTLTDLLNEAGLRTRPTAMRPSRPVARTSIHRILRDDYYTGVVTRNGVKRPGRHQALVDRDTFERVQGVLDAHRAGGERSQKHSHYLNGSLYCRVCGARLGYGNHRGKLGGYYEYYSCLSRVQPTGPCSNPYAAVERVEEAVAKMHADRPWLNEQEQTALREAMHEFVTAKAATAEAEAERHSRRLHELTLQQQKLVQLYYRDAISVEVLQAEQLRIADEQAQVERWQSQAIAQVDDVMQALDDALLLLCEPGEAYEQADPSLKKILNRAIFQRILIQVVDRRVEAEGEAHEVYAALVETAKSLGMAPDRPPDILLQVHHAVRNGSRRTIRLRPSTNKPQPAFQGSGFARRSDGGEGGIRTRDGG